MTNSIDFSEDYADPESGIVNYATVLGLMPRVEGRTYADSIYEFLPALKRWYPEMLNETKAFAGSRESGA